MHTRNIGKGREKRRKKLKSMRRWERDGREEKVQGKCKGREGKEREEKRKKERFWILDDTGNLSMHVLPLTSPMALSLFMKWSSCSCSKSDRGSQAEFYDNSVTTSTTIDSNSDR